MEIDTLYVTLFQTGLAVGDVQEIRDNATVEQLAKRVSITHSIIIMCYTHALDL